MKNTMPISDNTYAVCVGCFNCGKLANREIQKGIPVNVIECANCGCRALRLHDGDRPFSPSRYNYNKTPTESLSHV